MDSRYQALPAKSFFESIEGASVTEQQLILPAYLKSFRSLADQSLQINFETQEISAEMGASLFKFNSKQKMFGTLIFLSEGERLTEVPPTPSSAEDFKQPRSASQVLRGRIFRLWEVLDVGRVGVGFEVFYQAKMKELTDSVDSEIAMKR